MKQVLRKNRHSVFTLKYHLVVVTKYRNPVINEDVFKRLSEIAENIFEDRNKCNIVSMNYEPDHTHILIDAVPQICLSVMVNSFKTVSSRLIRKEFADYLQPFYWEPVFWSNSYFVSSVGETSTETVKEYIQSQAKN